MRTICQGNEGSPASHSILSHTFSTLILLLVFHASSHYAVYGQRVGTIFAQQQAVPGPLKQKIERVELPPLPAGDKRTYRERADEAIRNKNIELALEFLRQWCAAVPRDLDAQLLMVRLYLRLGDAEEALNLLRSSAQAGLATHKAIVADTLFNTLRNRRTFDDVLAQIKRNSDYNEFGVGFAEQKRIARYRILYPEGYDEKSLYNLVVLFHGNSQEPSLLLRWARQLGLTNAIVICPEAPYTRMKESLNGFATRLSAAGEELGYPDTLRENIIVSSSDWYHEAAQAAMKSLPVRQTPPVLVGFSQGGFYASVVASRYPASYRSVVMICPSMYPEGRVIERLPNVFKYGIDFLLAHSTDDQVVPYQTSVLFKNALDNAKILNLLYPFKGGHWPSEEATKRIADWIRQKHSP